MLPKRVQVLKHHQVEVSGSLCLQPSGTASVRSSATAKAGAPAAGQPQQARVVESNSEYAIIEVICSCGGKSHIQCNYAHINEGS
jgi:hypothetical protein